MNVLVTGGSGKLAGYLAKELSDHDVLLVDVVPPPMDRSDANFMLCDVTSYEDCKKAIAECEPQVIVALGALPWPTDDTGRREALQAAGRPMPPFDTTMRVNVMGLYYLLQAAVEAGVETVIQTSSIVTIVGSGTDYQYLPVDDRHPGCATNSYNYSKIAGELMLQWFSKTFGIQTLCPRPAWNWAPEALQQFAKEVKPAEAFENGGLWHYIDTRDVAMAHRQILDARDTLPKHDAYLVHAADHRALEDSRELVEKFRPDLLQRDLPIYLSGRQAFVSCEKAHNAFGFTPRYSWTDYL